MNKNINAHDRSIIGVICQYPDMSVSEKQKAIRKLNNQNLKPIIEVLTGLENNNILSKDDNIVLNDIPYSIKRARGYYRSNFVLIWCIWGASRTTYLSAA